MQNIIQKRRRKNAVHYFRSYQDCDNVEERERERDKTLKNRANGKRRSKKCDYYLNSAIKLTVENNNDEYFRKPQRM